MTWLTNFYTKYRSYFRICFMCFFAFSIYFFVTKKIEYRNKDTQLVKMQAEIIQKDSLVKITDGKYKKIVDYMKTPNQLGEQVKHDNSSLYSIISKNKETILSNTGLSFTMKPKSTVTQLTKKDSLYIFTSYYPKKDSAFVVFDGSLNTNNSKLTEKWTFNNIKLDVILTQRPDGLWNSYLSAPNYVIVNSIKINSLPPASYAPIADKPKTFNFYGGLGVRSGISDFTSGTGKNLTVNSAVTIKSKVMIGLNIGTDNKVGAEVLVKF